MASYKHRGKEWRLVTLRDAIFHSIYTRLSGLKEKPDPHTHSISTSHGELVCVLRAPVLWTAFQQLGGSVAPDGVISVKGVKQLVWSTIPPTKTMDDDFVLYFNENNLFVQRTLSEILDKRLLPAHLEVLLMVSVSVDTSDQRTVVKILGGDTKALDSEYAYIEKLYSPKGIYGDLVATPVHS